MGEVPLYIFCTLTEHGTHWAAVGRGVDGDHPLVGGLEVYRGTSPIRKRPPP